MPGDDRGRPRVYSIPVHRNFADALVNGLIARHGADRLGLARGIILVPNNRAALAITNAFVRRAEPALLLPRIVPIGDAGDEAMSVALDPADGTPPPAAVDDHVRRFALARLVQQVRAIDGARIDAAEALKLGSALGATLDTLLAEEIEPERLRTLAVGDDLAVHWRKSLDVMALILDQWPDELARMGRIDRIARRNMLLRRQAAAWEVEAPPGFVIAAGITTSAIAVAALLRAIARLPNGTVVLPGVDLDSPEEEWNAIAEDAMASHPQHHLRLLLDRMDVARSDVAPWRWGDGAVARAERARSVANAFVPAAFTSKWQHLKASERSLPQVRLAEFATPADEAQGIAIALREAIETPQRTAALVTPDRALAQRVAAHLGRWAIDADDSAGRPLSVTPPGTLILAVIEAAMSRFAPVALLALLKHPLVMAGESRLEWLSGARLLDLALRGPRPAPGLGGIAAHLAGSDRRSRGARAAAQAWWTSVAPRLEPLGQAFACRDAPLVDLLEAVRASVQALAGDGAWSGAAGRAASALFADLAVAMPEGPLDADAASLGPIMTQLMADIAIRPPQGGHPRISIWGLLEARLQSADLLVLGGLNEGVWPAGAVPDPWLAPRVRAELGLGAVDRRIGLAAHDLAIALGGRDVLLTRARRDGRSPTIASRFVLRLEAMVGGLARDERIVALSEGIDTHGGPSERRGRPAPSPPVAARPRIISVTEVDRLKADPYAFYARRMLRLTALDAVDADPSPAWRGTAVHAIFDAWFKADKLDPDRLHARVSAFFAQPEMHPLLRALWQPRLNEAMQWIAARVADDSRDGRSVVASEASGHLDIAGVRLTGTADRIDRDAHGLAIVDYKTGKAPSAAMVRAGFAMQLGLLGLIADRGGFDGVRGTATQFEYWSLSKDRDAFGKRVSPVKVGGDLPPDRFTALAASQFSDAVGRWLTGDEPFTAMLHPEYASYGDYHQLMRRDEWYGRG